MKFRKLLVLTAVLIVAPLADVGAAPQMLALLATNGAAPLTCENGVCRAEFSAICLQQERKVPTAYTLYELVGDGEVSLVSTDWAGNEQRVALAGPNVRIRTLRQYSAIEISVPETDLVAREGVELAIDVGPRVTLIPTPQPGDPDPHTYAEVVEVTGSKRVAAAWLDRAVDTSVIVVQITNELINSLPPDEDLGLKIAAQLEADILARHGADASKTRAAEMALSTYKVCHLDKYRAYYRSVRRCLQAYHDHMVKTLNSKYWSLVKDGG